MDTELSDNKKHTNASDRQSNIKSTMGVSMKPRGKFIVLEGIDGSGTTTHAKHLVKSLEADGISAMYTHEPTDLTIGRLIRSVIEKNPNVDLSPDWRTMSLLFAADRNDHVQNRIIPALESGVTVVCDRYFHSSIAYQSATAPKQHANEHDLDSIINWVLDLNVHAVTPTVTIILRISACAARARCLKRGGQVELFEVNELQEKLVSFYSELANYPVGPLSYVNSDRSFDCVASDVLAIAKR